VVFRVVVAEAEVVVHPVVGKVASACGVTALTGHLIRTRHFDAATLDRIADAIRSSELEHDGELLVVIETHLPSGTPVSHDRALEVFGVQRVWDTNDGTGLLLYIALGDHCIELVADRGITVADEVWADICAQLQSRFAEKDFAEGLIAAIKAIETTLLGHLPRTDGTARNALSDRPVML